jgi:CBS domain-containing protein
MSLYDRQARDNLRATMSTDLLTATPDEALVAAAKRMAKAYVGALLVLEGDALAGIVTERDVLRAVASGSVEGPVSAWMTRDPETVDVSGTVAEVATLMIHGGFRHVPVMDGGRVVGIVSMRDIARLANEAPAGV